MQSTEEKLEDDQRFDFYIPILNPESNSMYKLIEWYEREILFTVAFTKPTVESRELLHEIRGKLKHISCRNCEHLSQFKQVTTDVQVFQKSDLLSKSIEKLVLVQEEKKTTRMVMSCEGCRTLKLKQIATGYIKGRRFKQI